MDVANDELKINYFIDNLPIKYRNRIIQMQINKNYLNITFFQGKPLIFIQWIQPLLFRNEIEQDEYVYIENDEIDSINFLKKGAGAFVIPLQKNLIFTEIN